MDLFDETFKKLIVAPDVVLLKGFALNFEETLLTDLTQVLNHAPCRHMMTKMGFSLSASMTNCGGLGWVSDLSGYRYDPCDPLTQLPWPEMPASFQMLAAQAASEAGYLNFVSDACLINQYCVGASMGLHQDKNECDFTQPIVSVSLGIPAVFQFGGLLRRDKTIKIPLIHGDVIVWGGEARLKFHGIMPLKINAHPTLGQTRVNLTFRKAGCL